MSDKPVESNFDKNIDITSPYKLDSSAILGYKTGRPIKNFRLRIDSGATVRSGTVIYGGSTIGRNLQTGHNVVIREENLIGDGFQIWNNSTVDYGCVIGNHVKIHNNVYVAQFTTIEDNVFFAPGVIIGNDPHPICAMCMKGPTIKKSVRVGINVTLLPEVVIGEDSLIGAGSVITCDIPPRSVVMGNPGRVVKTIDQLACKAGHKERAYL